MNHRAILPLPLLMIGVLALSGHGQAAPNTAGAVSGRAVNAADFGIVCDGVTDTTDAMNSSRLSGRTIHLPDHKKCIAKVSGVDNTRWICDGCSIAHRPGDTTEGHTYIAYKSNIEFDGVAFDMNSVSIGSFVGGPQAATELLTVSGGSGFEPNFRFPFRTGNSGGCRSEVSGYITTDSKGMPDKAVITSPGLGCTSLPNPQLSSKQWGGDGYDHPVPPVFTWAKNAAPQRSAGGLTLFYVGNSKNIVFRSCRWLSTGATMGNLKANFNGMLVWKSDTTFINPTFENTIAGLQLKIDSGGDNVRSYIENIRSDGAQIDAVQLMGDPSNTEINGGLITNVGDMVTGSGEAGNAVNLYLTSHNKIHNLTILNPRFSGIRVTGGANASGRTSSYNEISDITIKGNREVGVWAELGAEFNSFKNISISDCDSGVSGTNIGDRPHGGANTFSHLLISGCKGVGAALEHDQVTDSTIVDTPIAFRVGFGGTGKDNVISGNTCESTGHGYSLMAVCFGLDRYAKNPSLLNENAIKGTGVVGLASLEFSNRLIIQNMSNSNPAVISYNPNVNVRTAAPAVGNTYILSSIFGMVNAAGQSINGHLCTASAVNMTGKGPNPYSITCGGSRSMPALDTTAYNVKPYEHPPPGQSNPELLELYKDGDKTPFWAMPAPIDTRSAFRKAR
jgi:hypothetical protein